MNRVDEKGEDRRLGSSTGCTRPGFGEAVVWRWSAQPRQAADIDLISHVPCRRRSGRTRFSGASAHLAAHRAAPRIETSGFAADTDFCHRSPRAGRDPLTPPPRLIYSPGARREGDRVGRSRDEADPTGGFDVAPVRRRAPRRASRRSMLYPRRRPDSDRRRCPMRRSPRIRSASRWSHSPLSFLLLLALLIVPTVGVGTTAAGAQTANDTLIVAVPSDIQNLDPTLSSADVYTQEIADQHLRLADRLRRRRPGRGDGRRSQPVRRRHRREIRVERGRHQADLHPPPRLEVLQRRPADRRGRQVHLRPHLRPAGRHRRPDRHGGGAGQGPRQGRRRADRRVHPRPGQLALARQHGPVRSLDPQPEGRPAAHDRPRTPTPTSG